MHVTKCLACFPRSRCFWGARKTYLARLEMSAVFAVDGLQHSCAKKAPCVAWSVSGDAVPLHNRDYIYQAVRPAIYNVAVQSRAEPAWFCWPCFLRGLGALFRLGHDVTSPARHSGRLIAPEFGECLSCMTWDNNHSAPAAQRAPAPHVLTGLKSAALQALAQTNPKSCLDKLDSRALCNGSNRS